MQSVKVFLSFMPLLYSSVSQTACRGSLVCRGRFSDVSRLNIYTSFQLKLNKCCHEVMVDNVGDRVMLLEKVVISRKKRSLPFSLSSVMLFAIKMNRFMWLVCREICLAFLLCQQTKKFGKHCSTAMQ